MKMPFSSLNESCHFDQIFNIALIVTIQILEKLQHEDKTK